MYWDYVGIKKHRAHPSTRTSSHLQTHLLAMPDGGSGDSNDSGKDSANGKNSGGDDGGCSRVGGSSGNNDHSNDCPYYGRDCDGGGNSDSNSG